MKIGVGRTISGELQFASDDEDHGQSVEAGLARSADADMKSSGALDDLQRAFISSI
jgi:hypothetical protein